MTVYRATGCCSLEFDCKKMEILDQLNRFRLGNVKVLADGEENKRISVAEMKNRKLDQQLKNKLRLRIIMEAAADMVLPMPVQLAYHAWQVVTLRNL